MAQIAQGNTRINDNPLSPGLHQAAHTRTLSDSIHSIFRIITLFFKQKDDVRINTYGVASSPHGIQNVLMYFIAFA